MFGPQPRPSDAWRYFMVNDRFQPNGESLDLRPGVRATLGLKAVVFSSTLIVCLAAAAIFFVGMIVALNGYGESDATWGMAGFAAIALLSAVIAGAAAAGLFSWLIARSFRTLSASAMAITACSVVGVAAEFICSIFGVLIAELARRYL